MPSILQTYLNKISNKLCEVVHLTHAGKKKGDVLLSYITDPFTRAPNEGLTDPHTNKWECAEIARLFSVRGYAVDIIDFRNSSFIPHKKYAVCVDIMQNLERLAPHLPASCKKVMHITSSYAKSQNDAEQERLKNLYARRGIVLQQARVEVTSRNPTFADFLEGLGNQTVHATYKEFHKPIFPIPISVAKTFPFPGQKNFNTARTNFLWFGGGGAILKGLDLVLEVFAVQPQLTLHIVGPVNKESPFMEAYKRELALPNVVIHPRPRISPKGEMRCGDTPFVDIANKCAALIYPSASEGTSGAVVQAMHAGIIPIVTKRTGIYEDAPVIPCDDPTVASLTTLVLDVATKSENVLREHAHQVWTYARGHYTREAFTHTYNKFIDDILKI